ncbi:MAG TPA: phage portal protein [Chthoniobacterales bacterium]|nr:phage portal protein [Chthoniobacterales bacterium]
MGGQPIPQSAQSAIVEACVSAYAQTLAMCPADHWKANDKGGRDRVTNSALSRILKKPNDYQSNSDFFMNMVRYMYLTGNSYALGVRNQRFEIDELHIMHPEMSWPQLATTGDVFYRMGGNHVVNYRVGEGPVLVPQRDVLHLRLHINRSRWPYPLIGETPLMSAMGDVYVQSAMMDQQSGFYRNQARPSAVLQTDLVLDKEQVQSLRDRWNEQTKSLQAGGTPILTGGLKVSPWTVQGRDAQLAEMMKITEDHIALAFRVPSQVLGLAREGGTSYRSTEVLMQQWIATGLGFCLAHVEEALNLMFGLKGKPDEYVEFNTQVLLRSAHKDRIDALARGVQGGIYSPNEARGLEGLDRAKSGDEPRVQQQVVPLSAAEGIPKAPGPNAAPPALGPKPPVEPPPQLPKPKPQAKQNDVQRELRTLRAGAARIGRDRVNP